MFKVWPMPPAACAFEKVVSATVVLDAKVVTININSSDEHTALVSIVGPLSLIELSRSDED